MTSAEAARLEALVDDERRRWLEQFGGGMLPFDAAYREVIAQQREVRMSSGGVRLQPTRADAESAGVSAVLDAFVVRLKARLRVET